MVSYVKRGMQAKGIWKQDLEENIWDQEGWEWGGEKAPIFLVSTHNTNKLQDLWNPEVQYRIHKGSPIIPILSRVNPIPRIDAYFLKIHSNIVFPSTPTPS